MHAIVQFLRYLAKHGCIDHPPPSPYHTLSPPIFFFTDSCPKMHPLCPLRTMGEAHNACWRGLGVEWAVKTHPLFRECYLFTWCVKCGVAWIVQTLHSLNLTRPAPIHWRLFQGGYATWRNEGYWKLKRNSKTLVTI